MPFSNLISVSVFRALLISACWFFIQIHVVVNALHKQRLRIILKKKLNKKENNINTKFLPVFNKLQSSDIQCRCWQSIKTKNSGSGLTSLGDKLLEKSEIITESEF